MMSAHQSDGARNDGSLDLSVAWIEQRLEHFIRNSHLLETPLTFG